MAQLVWSTLLKSSPNIGLLPSKAIEIMNCMVSAFLVKIFFFGCRL